MSEHANPPDKDSSSGIAVGLEEVIATDEFYRRPSRPPDYEAENRAIVALAREVLPGPGNVFRKLAELALELCAAGTAGVSLLEPDEGGDLFRWVAIAGALAPHLGGVTRRDFGPCGTCVERGTPQLFQRPERYYHYFNEVEPPIVEGLLLPFYIDDEPAGTLWVVAHGEGRRFDAEDLRVLNSLGHFASIAAGKLRQEEVLRRSEARWRAIFEESRDGILVEDDERIIYANQSYARLFGYEDPEELIGRYVSAVISTEDTERMLEFGRRRARGELPESVYEFKGKRKDGALVEVEASVSTSTVAGRTLITTMVRNIAERKRGEELLRASEAQLQTLFDETPIGVYLIDAGFRIRAVNPTALPVFGDIPELIGRDFDEVIHVLWEREYADELVRLFRRTLETGEPHFAPERIEERRDRGVTEYYEWQINRIPLPEGGYGVVCYFRDISASVSARQKIAESETKYRTLFESIDEGFCIIEVLFDGNAKPIDYRFLEVSPSFERQTGIANAAGRRMREITPLHEEYWFEIYGKVALTGEPVRFENRAEQLHRWYEVYAFRVGEPRLRCVGILFHDITERKRAEGVLKGLNERLEQRVAERTSELLETNASLQAEVAERRRAEHGRAQVLRHLVMAQEDERRRIAREMHDQFGQQLTTLLLKLGLLKEDCGGQKELCEQVETLEAVARRLDSDVDFLVWELRPTVLDDLGLEDALANYAQNWSKHFGVPVEVHARGAGKSRLTFETETVLYRIAQEALNNVAKHARATNVSILLEHRADTVSLIIEDDGVGFDSDKSFDADDKGLGLVGMRERAALVGGTTEIDARPGAGVTVYVRIPASRATRERETRE